MQTRRERVRQAAIDEIKSIAWDTAKAKGLEQVTINGIARQMGMTPPAFYSYFKSRDDLIRALTIEAYQSYHRVLVTAQDSVPESDIAGRMYRVYIAYREWCIDNPSMFRLFTGRPVHGFEDQDQVVIQEAERIYSLFSKLYEDGWRKGVIVEPPTDPYLPTSHVKVLKHSMAERKLNMPIGLFHRMINIAYFFHGMISMELSGRFSAITTNRSEYYRYQVLTMMKDLGIDYSLKNGT